VDLASGVLVTALVSARTVHKADDNWVCFDMTGGQAPISITKIYYP
jgi:hypothetical protein